MPKTYGQREYMRMLFQKFDGNESKVIAAYAQAEGDGIVLRKSKKHYDTPKKYATALWYDGHRTDGKGRPWLS